MAKANKKQKPDGADTAIYVLVDPRSPDEVRYVGKSKDPKARLLAHKVPPRNIRSPVAHWTRKLRRDGALVQMRILEWTPDWEAAERKWIAHYRANGANLLNVEEGGLGSWARGGRKPKRGNRIFSEAMKIGAWAAQKMEHSGQSDRAALLRAAMDTIRKQREAVGLLGPDALDEFDRGFTKDNLYQRQANYMELARSGVL